MCTSFAASPRSDDGDEDENKLGERGTAPHFSNDSDPDSASETSSSEKSSSESTSSSSDPNTQTNATGGEASPQATAALKDIVKEYPR